MFWTSVRRDGGAAEVVLPHGRAQLVVDGAVGGSLVVGPHTRPAVVRTPTASAGVSFTGSGLHALSDVPVGELVDDVVDSDAVVGHRRWDRCLEQHDPAAILDALELDTLQQLRTDTDRNLPIVAVERMIREGGDLDVAIAAADVDRRRLAPLFRDAVGIGPKRYQRIVRFQRAVRLLRSAAAPPLASIAANCGYADQAHMTRDVKEFSGVTPARLHGDASPAHNHVALAAGGGDVPPHESE